MNNTDDTFIAGGPGSSPSGFSNDDDATFIEGGIAAEIEGAARYQIESEIGRGGMAIVYLATDAKLNRKVALKRIGGDLFPSGSSGRRQSINLLKTEAQSLANLQHSNIVYVYDVGMDGDGMYMAMEYVDGGTLKDRILEDGPLNPEETARMGFQLCDALSMVHEKGIVHRDIKPGNVLLTKRGMPKLADFDLVLDTASNREVAGAFLGTLHYMSPEQRVDSGQVDFRSDLYSLGATLYFAATGSVPEKIDPDKIHESLRSVIQKALQENPLFRFSSALDMKKAFEEVLKAQIAEQAPGGHGAGTFPCYACSKLIPNGAVYCPECGKDLIEARKGIEKQVSEALSTVESLVSKDMYRESRDFLKEIQEKVKHPHFVYFKRRLDEKTVWVGKEEKKCQDREAEITQELHKAQEALAALKLGKASEIAQGIVKEERRFDALARKAREVIHKCEEIVGRRRQFEKDTAEASRLADTKAFDKAFGLLSSILNENNPAYAEQREAAAHMRDTLLARVKRLEEGLNARLAEAQAALDADRLDDAFHKASELETEADHITYQDTFKNITDQSRELVKACHNQVAQYLENAQERANNKSFDEAYALLDKVLNLSAGAFGADREKAGEAKIRVRRQELEHHMAVAAESVSQKNFEEAFRVLNLVIEEKSWEYAELRAEAILLLIDAKRKQRWRKIRIPLFVVIIVLAGMAYGYHYYRTNILNYTLTIDVEPKQASISIIEKRGAMLELNITEPYTPGMKLHPGNYRIEACAEGYETATQDVDLNTDRRVSLKLSDLYQTLNVDAEPSDATIKILNIVPKFEQGIRLGPGKYLIEVSAKGYEAKQEWIELQKGEQKRFRVQLESEKVASKPSILKNISPIMELEIILIVLDEVSAFAKLNELILKQAPISLTDPWPELLNHYTAQPSKGKSTAKESYDNCLTHQLKDDFYFYRTYDVDLYFDLMRRHSGDTPGLSIVSAKNSLPIQAAKELGLTYEHAKLVMSHYPFGCECKYFSSKFPSLAPGSTPCLKAVSQRDCSFFDQPTEVMLYQNLLEKGGFDFWIEVQIDPECFRVVEGEHLGTFANVYYTLLPVQLRQEIQKLDDELQHTMAAMQKAKARQKAKELSTAEQTALSKEKVSLEKKLDRYIDAQNRLYKVALTTLDPADKRVEKAKMLLEIVEFMDNAIDQMCAAMTTLPIKVTADLLAPSSFEMNKVNSSMTRLIITGIASGQFGAKRAELLSKRIATLPAYYARTWGFVIAQKFCIAKYKENLEAIVQLEKTIKRSY